MATITDVQLQVFCHFCEKKHVISWKCLHCMDLYCNDCKKVHEKFAVSKDHIIVPLERLSDQMMAEQKLKILSAVKSKGTCDLYCVQCQVRVKNVDTVAEHVTHQLDQFEHYQKSQDVKIESLISKINSELVEHKPQDSQKQRTLEKKEMKKAIQQRYEEIIQSCKNKVNALNTEIDEFYKEREERVRESNTQVNKERAKIGKAKDKLATLKNKNKTSNLESAYKDLEGQWKHYLSILPNDEQLSYHTGAKTPTEIAAEVGCVSFSSTASNDSKETHMLELHKTIYPIKLQTITLMSPCGDGQACIGGIKSKRIQLVNLENPSNAIHELSITFYDFSMSADGNLLYISDFENKSLKTLSKNGTVRTIKAFSRLFPTCVQTTSENEIYVGVVESDSKNMDSGSRRALLKLTNEGKVKSDLEFDRRGVRLFTVPYRCAFNEVTGHVVIIDKYNPFSGRIIGIKQNGDVEFRYTGFGNAARGKQFLPTDIKCTKNGEVVICDVDNHSLHILDKDGNWTQNISTLEVNILHPYCLAVDSNEHLWIGTCPPANEKLDGRIYITSLTKKPKWQITKSK